MKKLVIIFVVTFFSTIGLLVAAPFSTATSVGEREEFPSAAKSNALPVTDKNSFAAVVTDVENM